MGVLDYTVPVPQINQVDPLAAMGKAAQVGLLQSHAALYGEQAQQARDKMETRKRTQAALARLMGGEQSGQTGQLAAMSGTVPPDSALSGGMSGGVSSPLAGLDLGSDPGAGVKFEGGLAGLSPQQAQPSSSMASVMRVYRQAAQEAGDMETVQAIQKQVLEHAKGLLDLDGEKAAAFYSEAMGTPIKFKGKASDWSIFDTSSGRVAYNPLTNETRQVTDPDIVKLLEGDARTVEMARRGMIPQATLQGAADFAQLKRPVTNVSTHVEGEPVIKTAQALRKEFEDTPEAKNYAEVSRQFNILENARKLGDDPKARVATDQALVTIYNKLMDPNSVVRESEYARTEEMTGFLNSIRGKMQKLLTGGAALTNEERDALVQAGKAYQAGSYAAYNRRGSAFENMVREQSPSGQIKPEHVVLRIPGPSAPAEGNPEITASSGFTTPPTGKGAKKGKQAAPAASPFPEFPQARQAPDGNWYVQQNGQWARVEQ